MEEKTIEKGDMAVVYEVSYLLLPSLAQEQVPAKADAIQNIVTSAGGAVISGENPVLIDLAYPMVKVISTVRHKVVSGYFGWLKFELSAEGIEKVKKALDANDDVVRYLIIRTVRENTLLTGKMKLQKEERVRREEDGASPDAPAEKAEVNPEEVDKSIDDLVIA
jgi:ribosomal protein S6